jgi:hypothetical protein
MRTALTALVVMFLSGIAAAADHAQHCCGFDPIKHRLFHGEGGVSVRGVNNSGTMAARWLNNTAVSPMPPDQKTVVTYSIVSAAENYVGQALVPVVDSEFIGAETIAVIRAGLESWNDVAGIKLQFVQSNGQIRVGAGDLTGTTIGFGGFSASRRGEGPWYMTQGFVKLDRTDGTWTASKLRTVSAHEMGHALGLNHTTDNTALMAPTVNASMGPLADDRWYIQNLYGSAPAKASGNAFQSAPVMVTIGRAAPKQTGTDSDPTFEESFNIGSGTGSKTQDDVTRYVVERKGPSDAAFVAIDSNVLAPGQQNADGTISHEANAFTFADATVTGTGTFAYRVKAVHQTDDVYSSSFIVSIGGAGSNDPENIDTDADGFPDIVETALNTSATDAGSTPFGGLPATNSEFLTVTKASVSLNFKQTGKDAFSLAGTIAAPDTFTVENKPVIVNLGGLVRSFTLTSKGTAIDRDAKAKVGPKVSKGLLKYTFSGSKAAYQEFFDDETFTSRDTLKTGENVNVLATVYINNTKYISVLNFLYKAKTGSTGKGSKVKE